MGQVTRPAKGGIPCEDLRPAGGKPCGDLSSGGGKGSDHRHGSECGKSVAHKACSHAGEALLYASDGFPKPDGKRALSYDVTGILPCINQMYRYPRVLLLFVKVLP